MPDPAALRAALLALVSLGYGALALRLAWVGLLLRLPFFFSYVVLLAAKGLWWAYHAGRPIPGFRWTETGILATKVLVVIEAYFWVTRHMDARPRRRLFLALLGAATLAGAAMAWLPEEPNITRAYVRQTLKVHVALAVFAGGACLTIWRRWEGMPEVPRRAWAHGLILTGHVVSRLTDLINYQAAATTERRWELYWRQQFLFLGLSLLWLVLWLWVVRRREKRGHPAP